MWNDFSQNRIIVDIIYKNYDEQKLLLSAQYSAILEMLRHDFSYEEAQHYVYTVNSFFREGWRSFLGF